MSPPPDQTGTGSGAEPNGGPDIGPALGPSLGPSLGPILGKETSHAMLIALILLSVTVAAVAQLTLKHGMNQVVAANGAVRFDASSLRAVATTPAVWLGLLLFGMSALVWLVVLSRTTLSFAYPFASLTYVLILLADRFLLHQPVPALRYAGVAFIIVGIVLVAQTRHA